MYIEYFPCWCDSEVTCSGQTPTEFGLCAHCLELNHKPLPPLPSTQGGEFLASDSVDLGPPTILGDLFYDLWPDTPLGWASRGAEAATGGSLGHELAQEVLHQRHLLELLKGLVEVHGVGTVLETLLEGREELEGLGRAATRRNV